MPRHSRRKDPASRPHQNQSHPTRREAFPPGICALARRCAAQNPIRTKPGPVQSESARQADSPSPDAVRYGEKIGQRRAAKNDAPREEKTPLVQAAEKDAQMRKERTPLLGKGSRVYW